MAQGLTLGPQSIDSEMDGMRLGAHNRADRLLKVHAQSYPAKLRLALTFPKDRARTDTLDLEEVDGTLRALRGRRAFFDADAGDRLLDAVVAGPGPEREYVVSVVFRRESGRAARGILDYADMAQSVAAYEQAKAEQDDAEQARKFGTAPQAPEAKPDEALIARLEALEASMAESQQREREAQERERALQEELEAARGPQAPFDGYDDLNAEDRAERVKSGGFVEFGMAGLEGIAEYEKARERPSKQVLKAVEEALDAAKQQG